MRRKLFYIDLILIFVLALYIGNWYYKDYKYKKEAEQLVEQYLQLASASALSQQPSGSTADEIAINKAKHERKINEQIIGRILIPKINLDYPLLASTTNENMKIGITKFFGAEINSATGNTVLAGHNMRKKGVLFTDLDKVAIGDEITLYDMSGNAYSYSVLDIFVVAPDDSSPLEYDAKEEKWLTLITCTDWGNKRLIIKAKKTA